LKEKVRAGTKPVKYKIIIPHLPPVLFLSTHQNKCKILRQESTGFEELYLLSVLKSLGPWGEEEEQ
jgi:hypothetical protein